MNIGVLGTANMTNSGHLLVAPKAQVFQYDADGNLTNDAVWAYRWDGENRLIQASNVDISTLAMTNRVMVNLTYDFMGRRATKLACSPQNGHLKNRVLLIKEKRKSRTNEKEPIQRRTNHQRGEAKRFSLLCLA